MPTAAAQRNIIERTGLILSSNPAPSSPRAPVTRLTLACQATRPVWAARQLHGYTAIAATTYGMDITELAPMPLRPNIAPTIVGNHKPNPNMPKPTPQIKQAQKQQEPPPHT